MKRLMIIALFILLSCEDKKQEAQEKEFSLDLVGTIQFGGDHDRCGTGKGGTDIWGYKDEDGSLYGIMGTYYGVSIFEIPSLRVVDSIPGPQENNCAYHKDIKTYGHYAYVTSENAGRNEGVMIIDLQYLPDSVHYVGSYINGSDIESHNISIDEATGFAYIQTHAGRIRIVDLSNPEAPFDVGMINAIHVHDMFARNDTVWVAEGYNSSYSIWDLSNKSNPEMLLRFYSGDRSNGSYAHNIWPNESGTYFATTEETAGVPVKLMEVKSDYSGVFTRGTYLAESNLAHDVKVFKNKMFISHYESGVIIVDISDPQNPVLLGSYDTYEDSETSNYNGCWGVYPFIDDGYIIASNVNGTMTLLSFSD